MQEDPGANTRLVSLTLVLLKNQLFVCSQRQQVRYPLVFGDTRESRTRDSDPPPSTEQPPDTHSGYFVLISRVVPPCLPSYRRGRSRVASSRVGHRGCEQQSYTLAAQPSE